MGDGDDENIGAAIAVENGEFEPIYENAAIRFVVFPPLKRMRRRLDSG